MKSILVLTCLCFIDTSSVHGASKKVMNFMSYFNGDFDNKAQTEEPGDNHDLIEGRFIPVDIKCLNTNPVLSVEEFVNGNLLMHVLAEVTDGIEDTVSVTMYNFTHSTNYRPRELTMESLYNISCADIQEIKDCIASYRVAQGFVYGNFPLCSFKIHEKYPQFSSIHLCKSISATMPMYSQQKSPTEPYELQLTSQKYPLINKPPGYVAPCGN